MKPIFDPEAVAPQDDLIIIDSLPALGEEVINQVVIDPLHDYFDFGEYETQPPAGWYDAGNRYRGSTQDHSYRIHKDTAKRRAANKAARKARRNNRRK